jgi:membrane protease YdiL (CAAX protease family)
MVPAVDPLPPPDGAPAEATAPAPPPPPPQPPRAAPLLLLLLAILPLSAIGAASLLAGALVTQAALLLVTLRWAHRSRFEPTRLLRLSRPPPGALWLGAGVGVAGILAGAGLQSLTREVLPSRLVEAFDVGRALMRAGWSRAVLLGVVSLLPALCEELAFRGGLQSALAGRRSPARAVALSALVFAVFHLDPIRFPGVLLLGVAFGWLAWRTGSIWPSMVAHAVNNGTAVLGLLLASQATDPDQAEAVGPAEAGALLVVGLALYALAAAAAGRWLPPAPPAASFLVPRPLTTAGAAPSPSGTGLP